MYAQGILEIPRWTQLSPPRLAFGTAHSSFWWLQRREPEHNMLETVAELKPSELTF